MALLKAENENGQLVDMPQADFGRVPERVLLSVRTKSIVGFYIVSTYFSILSLSANAPCDSLLVFNSERYSISRRAHVFTIYQY